jgi:hypothetical protein
LKIYRSPGIDEIPAEIIQARMNTQLHENYKFINCNWNEEELMNSGRKRYYCTYF